jgi:hypothetical protein
MPIKARTRLFTFGRCSHLTPTGRQCRSLVTDPDSKMCPHHSTRQSHDGDYSRLLLSRAHNLRCATGISNALASLYELLATDAISAARATALTRMLNMMLRALPLVQNESECYPCLHPTHPARPESAATLHEIAQVQAQAAAAEQQRDPNNQHEHPLPREVQTLPPITTAKRGQVLYEMVVTPDEPESAPDSYLPPVHPAASYHRPENLSDRCHNP